MGLTQLDIIRKQIESAAKNRAAGEAAKLRRKTSLIGEISRMSPTKARRRRTSVRTAMCAARPSSRCIRRRTTGAGCCAGPQGLQ